MLRLAWRNIWRNRRRTWLTVSAIAFSAALLIFSITLQLGSYDMMIEHSQRLFTGQIQVQREGYLDRPQIRKTVPRAAVLADRIRARIGHTAVAVRALGFALVSSATRSYGVQVVGVQPDREGAVSTIPNVVRQGRFLSADHALEAVVGAGLARNLKVKPGDEITLLGSGRDGSFAASVVSVVGIFESGVPDLDRYMLEIPLGSFQEIFSMADAAHAIVISGERLEGLAELRTRVSALLPENGPLVAVTWDQITPGIKQAIQFDMLNGWIFYGSLIVIVTFSILNTFLMAVLERTREFGLMLAVGARPARIGALVMLESFLVTAIGLGIGLALGLGISVYFYVYGFTYPGLEEYGAQFGFPGVITPEISLLAVGLGPLAILVFTLVAALYPAIRIRRLRPVDALRAV